MAYVSVYISIRSHCSCHISGLTLLKPSHLAILLVPKLSENDLGLISVASKNSASLLLLLPLPPRLPLLNLVRIDISSFPLPFFTDSFTSF